MPRPRGRPPGQQPASRSTPQKRTLSSTTKPTPPSTSTATPTRQSKRIKSTPVTSPATKNTKPSPQKSPFFHHDPDSQASESESAIEGEASGYEDEDGSVTAESENEAEEDEEDENATSSSEEDVARKRKRKRGAGRKSLPITATNNRNKNNHNKNNNNDGADDEDGDGDKDVTSLGRQKQKKGQELWRPGVKTSLAPGEEMWIPLPKAREAGNTPYQDHTVHPNTMAFLGELRENNEREWLKVHDADYRQSQKDFNSFVETLTGMIVEKDDTIPELPCKDLTHYSAAWSRTGRKGPYAGYYLQIKPSGSFIGAGLWQPEATPLGLMRQAIDTQPHLLKTVLLNGAMRKEFLKGVPAGGEGKAVAAFVEMNKENMLKTKPKGYDAINPNLPLLRLRSYTIGRKLKDEEVLGPDAATMIADLVGVLTPFVTYLNSVIMPDPDSGGVGDEDEDGDQDEDED